MTNITDLHGNKFIFCGPNNQLFQPCPSMYQSEESLFVPAGFNVDTLPVYAKRSQRMVITARKYPLSLSLSQTIGNQEHGSTSMTTTRLDLIPNNWSPLVSVLCFSAPVTNPPMTPKALTAGQKRMHPAYIPSHFPEFPDPHTYIKTPVSQPMSSYYVTSY